LKAPQTPVVDASFAELLEEWVQMFAGLPAELHVGGVVCSGHGTHRPNLPTKLQTESKKS